LMDGTRLEGDVGDFEISCQFRGQTMNLTRADIRLFAKPMKVTQPVENKANVQVQMFHQYSDQFYMPNQTTVDFDTSPNGSEIKRNSNVNEMFTNKGLKLGAEKKGFIGISGYGFTFEGTPTGGNSVCIFEPFGSYSRKFKGVLEISFCMPNQASVPAGVNEFGLHMARVNHSRDFLVEAYNSDGQILASVEASDEPCVFSGIKSSEPIAKIRILSNPYLFRIDRGIDEDFAVDSICFSKPIPIGGTKESLSLIRLRNGDLIKGDSIKVRDSNSVSIDMSQGKTITLALDELLSINFAHDQKPMADKSKWIAMLPDRSTIIVEPGESFASETFAPLKFRPSELMAIWTSRNPARFPEASDFKSGSSVMVFPTCRIASDDVKFSKDGFSWEKNAKKLMQPIEIEGDEKDDEDPTPQFHAVKFDGGQEVIPTIWLSTPMSRPANTGSLQLIDGQQLSLGPDASFQFTGLNDSTVTITSSNREFQIPLTNVTKIEFPAK